MRKQPAATLTQLAVPPANSESLNRRARAPVRYEPVERSGADSSRAASASRAATLDRKRSSAVYCYPGPHSVVSASSRAALIASSRA